MSLTWITEFQAYYREKKNTVKWAAEFMYSGFSDIYPCS